jgi:hypothetical protein
MTSSSLPYPPMLRVGVIASIAIVIGSFINSFIDLSWAPFAFFVAGLCGAFCGGVAIFSAKGFHRGVACLATAISLYALIRLVGYIGWAVNLP